MNGRTHKWKISPFYRTVPYRGRCPATARLRPENYIKRCKGTADHMMPLGDWFLFQPFFSQPKKLTMDGRTDTLSYRVVSHD